MNDGPSASGGDHLEDLVVECLRRFETEGESAVEAVCTAHPDLAAEIRAAIAAVRGLDLVPEAPAPAMPESPGDPAGAAAGAAAIGPYRLLGLLGEGGQGSVHLALDTRLDRKVAIKVLTGLGVASPGQLARFRREAELASRLDHPSLCAVYDVGTFEGIPYIVMRHVEGETLAARLARGRDARRGPAPLPDGLLWTGRSSETAADDGSSGAPTTGTTRKESWRDVEEMIRIVEEAARALHLAHENGIVHRDIKPGNIMLTPEGLPVILDFGLARDLAGEGELLTRTGDVFGTPSYMAPEQISPGSTRVDRRADVWALAVTLHECLTLEKPFTAPTRDALYRAILQRPPTDPRTRNPAIPRELKFVLDLALEKSPDSRYQTALAFAEDLARVRRHQSVVARPAPRLLVLWRWIQRNPAVAALGAAFFAVLAGGLRQTLDQGRKLQDRTLDLEASTARSRSTQDQLARAADGLLVEDLLRRAGRDLWPRRVEVVPAMEGWMIEARGVLARHPGPDSVTGTTPGTPAGGSPATSLTAGSLDRLREALSDVAARKIWAESLKDRTVTANAGIWAECAAGVAADLRFGGLVLGPQVDLVPLREDPDSGLWEFWHPDSGSRPGVDPGTGAPVMGEDSGMVLVLLPPGRLPGGSRRRGGLPVPGRDVDGVFISKFEMTQGQWLRIAGRNPSEYSPESPEWKDDPDLSRTDLRHPVEWVSLVEAEEMLRRLGLRVPDETEWEYAARAGTATSYFTGETPETLHGFANVGDLRFRRHRLGSNLRAGPEFDDGFAGHAPVGRFRPNAFGLHDMIGNVWELCRVAGTVRGTPGAYRGSSFWLSSDGRVHDASDRVEEVEAFHAGHLGVRAARSLQR